MENLCLNGSPGVGFQCVAYPGRFDTAIGIALEDLKPVLLRPQFTRYTIQNRICGNTGGGCMVATLETYLPELDKTIWVNCNLEGMDLTSADYVWNEDHSESWQRYEDVALIHIDFASDSPQTFPILAPLIQEAVTYFLQEELRRKPVPIPFPAKWLPGDFRDADHVTLAQAQKDDAEILLLPDGALQRCDWPRHTIQNQAGGGSPHLH